MHNVADKLALFQIASQQIMLIAVVIIHSTICTQTTKRCYRLIVACIIVQLLH